MTAIIAELAGGCLGLAVMGLLALAVFGLFMAIDNWQGGG